MNVLSLKFANLVIAVVLLVSPFIVGLTTSQYDPWADINEDGKIDIYDVAYTARSFGSSGDPGKNITVAKHVTELHRPAALLPIPPGSWTSGPLSTDGYAKVTVLIWLSDPSNCQIFIYACNYGGYHWLVETLYPTSNSWVKTYDVMNQQIRIEIGNVGFDAVTASVDVYLMA